MFEESHEPEFKEVVVAEGFYNDHEDHRRKKKFSGVLLCTFTNETKTGSNANRWHVWRLYKTKAGYLVVDEFHTLIDDGNHTKISRTFRYPVEISLKYPALLNHAVDLGLFPEDAIIEQIDEESDAAARGYAT